jgi:hypothetical protein
VGASFPEAQYPPWIVGMVGAGVIRVPVVWAFVMLVVGLVAAIKRWRLTFIHYKHSINGYGHTGWNVLLRPATAICIPFETGYLYNIYSNSPGTHACQFDL